MLYTTILAQVLLFTLTASAAKKAATPDVAETDVGSILKSMNQTKLATIPADARAVMKKMPETPAQVTPADRMAINSCLNNTMVDTLGKEACAAQKDQISVVIDKKKNVSPKNMQTFVTSAKAAGAVIPKPEK